MNIVVKKKFLVNPNKTKQRKGKKIGNCSIESENENENENRIKNIEYRCHHFESYLLLFDLSFEFINFDDDDFKFSVSEQKKNDDDTIKWRKKN